jgi:hypothetical protein
VSLVVPPSSVLVPIDKTKFAPAPRGKRQPRRSPPRSALLPWAKHWSNWHTAAGSDQHELAYRLYKELERWCVGMDEIVVLGDLNETLTMHDRQPRAAASPAAPIAHLRDDGFTDVYRHLDPDALLAPGFTHFIDGVRPSCSRIDYIWSKGLRAASLLRVRIFFFFLNNSNRIHKAKQPKLQNLSHNLRACTAWRVWTAERRGSEGKAR